MTDVAHPFARFESGRVVTMMSRSRSKSCGASSPSRSTAIATWVPFSPRSRSAASSIERPALDFPSIFTITSPVRIPACQAGPPSIGEITVG